MFRVRGKHEGSYIYVYDGYKYYLDNRNARYPVLRCSQRKGGCDAVIYIDSSKDIFNQDIEVQGMHMDDQDDLFVLRHKFTEEVKTFCRSTFDDLKQIYDFVKAKPE